MGSEYIRCIDSSTGTEYAAGYAYWTTGSKTIEIELDHCDFPTWRIRGLGSQGDSNAYFTGTGGNLSGSFTASDTSGSKGYILQVYVGGTYTNSADGSGTFYPFSDSSGGDDSGDDGDDDDEGGSSGGSGSSGYYDVEFRDGGYIWDYFPSSSMKQYEGQEINLPQPYRNQTTSDGGTFIITGNANGGDNNTSLTVAKNITSTYVFDGWRDKEYNKTHTTTYDDNHHTILYAMQSSTSTTTYSNNTLAFLSKPKRSTGNETYIVNYNGNGGNVNRNSDTAGRMVNYSFAYWCSDSSGTGTKYTDSTSFTTNTTVYAIWNITSDNTTTISLPTATRDGYIFLGWAESPTSEYFITNTYTPSSSVTLYAQWAAKDDVTYTVNHHIKDAGVSTYSLHSSENKKATADSSITLSNLKINISGFTYKEGKVNGNVVSTVKVNSDGSLVIDLYYSRNTYTVTLIKTSNIQSVTGAGSYEHGASVTIQAVFDSSYTFSRWSGDYELNTNTNPATFIMPSQNISLTPELTYNSYTITYIANGGTGAPSAGTKQHNTTYTISSTRPTRTGYTFKGWSTSSTGSVLYQPGDSYTDNASITLYAIWTAKTYSITYNANGGTGAPSKGTKYHGTAYKISSTVPVKEGYNFMGWGTTSSATTASYQPGDNYTTNATLTLYAIWSIDSYTNTINHLLRGFKNNDGNAESGNCYLLKSETFTNTYKLAINLNADNAVSDIPKGFTLNQQFGSVNKDGGITYYNMNSTIYQEDSNMTFNFYYDPIEYGINYNLNGGNNNDNPPSYNILYGVSLNKPNKPGSRFGKWTDNKNAVITGINEGKTATFTDATNLYSELATRTIGDVSVYANWETLGSTVIPGVGTYQCFIYRNGEWVLCAPHIVKNGVWEPY